MKKIVIAGFFLTSVLTCGCSTGQNAVKTGNFDARADVFREVPSGSPVPLGYADLRVTASIKTHRQGVYPLRKDAHGTPDYLLLLTIDGQTAQLRGSLAEENCEPRRPRDTEAGEGIRYTFRTAVRLKAGTHAFSVASPDDDVTTEREITLAEGTSTTLVLEPIYGAAPGSGQPAFYGATSFLEGVRGFRIVVNGNP